MQKTLKKILPALALSLVSVTSSVNAVDDMQMRNLENRVNALEQRRGAGGMINPPARPVVKDGVDLWIEGEALYMRTTEDQLSYAVSSNSGIAVDGRAKNASYDWDWGFRVGAGYNLPHDGWDLFLNWTWFRNKHDNSMSADFVFPVVASPADSPFAGQANTQIKLKLNMLDLELGREFFVSKWLTMRPHFGLRAAWLHRTYDIAYSGGSVVAGNEVDVGYNTHNNALGVRGGLDTQWGLGGGWSIVGDAAFSLLYGKQRVSFEQDLVTAAGVSTEDAELSDRWMTVRAITDLLLGLRWDHLFYNDRYRIRFQLAWEQHMFFNFNQNVNFVDFFSPGRFVNAAGNLAISGASFQARFDF